MKDLLMNAMHEIQGLRRRSELVGKLADYRTPEEADALSGMLVGYCALKRLGWNDAIYCPKDGTVFLSISAGSTGVHACHYAGKWPKGGWRIHDAGDLWPGHPILWKPMTPNAPADAGYTATHKTTGADDENSER